MRRSGNTVSVPTHLRHRMLMEKDATHVDDDQHHSDHPVTTITVQDTVAKKQLIKIRDEVKKVNGMYKAKSLEDVNKDRSFTREILADSMFTLRNACEKLFVLAGELIEQNIKRHSKKPCVDDERTTEGADMSKDEVVNVLQIMILDIITVTVEELKNVEEKMILTDEINHPSQQCDEVLPQKHVLIVESDMDKPDEVINETKWSEVIKGSMGGRLKNVPVNKSVFTKDGKACVFLPTKESQEQAKIALEGKYKVVSSTVNQKQVLPKMKICDIDTVRYNKGCTKELHDTILQKNQELLTYVEKDKLTFQVVFIHEADEYAVVKMSPQIRQHIIKSGRRLYLDLSTHYAKDQFHLTQCFACQESGHKKGSPYCKANDVETCLYCAKDHKSKNLTLKKEISQHRCVNCLKSPLYSSKALGHTSTSQECPIVIRETRRLINKTAGIDAKNYYPQRTQTMISGPFQT